MTDSRGVLPLPAEPDARLAPLLGPARITEAEVVVFPHAGAFPGSYYRLAAGLSSRVAVRVVNLRAAHTSSLDAVLERLVVQLNTNRATPRLFAGHSLGALIAWETVQLMAPDRRPEVLAVSASGAPDSATSTRLARLLAEDPARLTRRLRQHHLLPGRDQEALTELYLHWYLQDLRLVVNHRWHSGPPIRTPIVAMHGRDDRLATGSDVASWRRCTLAGCDQLVFPGGHDYFWSNPSVAQVLARRVLPVRPARAP